MSAWRAFLPLDRIVPGLCALLLAGGAVPGIAAQTAAPAKAQAAPPKGGPAELKAFTVDDLVRLKRLTDPQLSPDGRYVAYVLRETDMEANKGRTDIWLLDLGQKEAQPQRLTTDPADDTSPRWA